MSGQSAALYLVVTRVAVDVAGAVTHFVAVEGFMVVSMRLAALGQCAMIAVIGIEAVIHMAVEILMAVVPGACAEEHPAVKPLRPVVTIRSAAVGCVVKIAVGAGRFGADAYPDADLCVRCGGGDGETEGRDCRKNENPA